MPAKLPKVQGLRRRWLAGSIGPVAAILLLVGVLISVGFASNYYNSARSTLRAKASSGADYFNTYVMTGYKEYYRSATLYAATFDDADRIELQFLNSAGRVEVTTRGLTAGTYPAHRRWPGPWRAARCRTSWAWTKPPASGSSPPPAC